MEFLVLGAATLGLLWMLIGLPQQRRVKAHERMVASLAVGEEVILTAGVYGRIVDLAPETVQVEVAPGVVVKVARMAVLRRVEDARPGTADAGGTDADTDADTVDLDGGDRESGDPDDGSPDEKGTDTDDGQAS